MEEDGEMGRHSRGASDVSEEGDKRLEHTWTWYYVERGAHTNLNQEEFDRLLQPLGTFSTIKSFWEYWSNIMETKDFPDSSTLFLFKEGIRPMWEDKDNVEGGKYSVVIPKNISNQVWSDLVLSCIGEQLDSEDQVCGIVLSTRARGNVISVWVRNCIGSDNLGHKQDNEAIAAHFGELLDNAAADCPGLRDRVEFFKHGDNIAHNEELRRKKADEATNSSSTQRKEHGAKHPPRQRRISGEGVERDRRLSGESEEAADESWHTVSSRRISNEGIKSTRRFDKKQLMRKPAASHGSGHGGSHGASHGSSHGDSHGGSHGHRSPASGARFRSRTPSPASSPQITHSTATLSIPPATSPETTPASHGHAKLHLSVRPPHIASLLPPIPASPAGQQPPANAWTSKEASVSSNGDAKDASAKTSKAEGEEAAKVASKKNAWNVQSSPAVKSLSQSLDQSTTEKAGAVEKAASRQGKSPASKPAKQSEEAAPMVESAATAPSASTASSSAAATTSTSAAPTTPAPAPVPVENAWNKNKKQESILKSTPPKQDASKASPLLKASPPPKALPPVSPIVAPNPPIKSPEKMPESTPDKVSGKGGEKHADKGADKSREGGANDKGASDKGTKSKGASDQAASVKSGGEQAGTASGKAAGNKASNDSTASAKAEKSDKSGSDKAVKDKASPDKAAVSSKPAAQKPAVQEIAEDDFPALISGKAMPAVEAKEDAAKGKWGSGKGHHHFHHAKKKEVEQKVEAQKPPQVNADAAHANGAAEPEDEEIDAIDWKTEPNLGGAQGTATDSTTVKSSGPKNWAALAASNVPPASAQVTSVASVGSKQGTSSPTAAASSSAASGSSTPAGAAKQQRGKNEKDRERQDRDKQQKETKEQDKEKKDKGQQDKGQRDKERQEGDKTGDEDKKVLQQQAQQAPAAEKRKLSPEAKEWVSAASIVDSATEQGWENAKSSKGSNRNPDAQAPVSGRGDVQKTAAQGDDARKVNGVNGAEGKKTKDAGSGKSKGSEGGGKNEAAVKSQMNGTSSAKKEGNEKEQANNKAGAKEAASGETKDVAKAGSKGATKSGPPKEAIKEGAGEDTEWCAVGGQEAAKALKIAVASQPQVKSEPKKENKEKSPVATPSGATTTNSLPVHKDQSAGSKKCAAEPEGKHAGQTTSVEAKKVPTEVKSAVANSTAAKNKEDKGEGKVEVKHEAKPEGRVETPSDTKSDLKDEGNDGGSAVSASDKVSSGSPVKSASTGGIKTKGPDSSSRGTGSAKARTDSGGLHYKSKKAPPPGSTPKKESLMETMYKYRTFVAAGLAALSAGIAAVVYYTPPEVV